MPSTRDRGYAMILAALVLVPLLAAVAFVVDIGAWYAKGSSTHKAADAAALAGVIWLPDVATATAAAEATAARNGFDDADPNISVMVVQTGPAELEVTITESDIPLYFAGLFVDDVDIERSATAEYVASVPMGSPENYLGNDPILGATPNLWLVTFGNATSKQTGDRYHSIPCTGVFCTAGINDEFDEDGYFFSVDAPSTAGPLDIEIFDVVHHDYGDHCTVGWLYDDGTVAGQPWYTGTLATYPEERYEKGGSGNPGGAGWCPGDNGLSGTNYEMTVIVREPDSTPLDYTNNPVVCWVRYGNDVPADQADLVTKLEDPAGTQPVASWSSGGTTVPGPSTVAFNDYFREWAPVCSINTPLVGEYVVQIRTNANTADPTQFDPGIYTQGRNRYSMRAGVGTPGTAGWSLSASLFAYGRLPMFVNRPGGDGVPTAFYVARVTPEYAGRQLQLDLYDLTDGSDLTVTFLPPAEEPTYSFFPSCTMSILDTAGTWPLTSSNCSATHLTEPRLKSGQAHAAAISTLIDVPLDYTCNAGSTFGCWVTVEMTFDGTPSDTTTWSASLSGDPIRLIE